MDIELFEEAEVWGCGKCNNNIGTETKDQATVELFEEAEVWGCGKCNNNIGSADK